MLQLILTSIYVYVAKEYQNCFHKTKQKLEENPAERQFDFSEMYIFGKFETFHRRLLKIMHIFDTITTYSVLQDSKLEGLEVMATKYQVCSFCFCFFTNITWVQQNTISLASKYFGVLSYHLEPLAIIMVGMESITFQVQSIWMIA